jgi:hypothetical protein
VLSFARNFQTCGGLRPRRPFFTARLAAAAAACADRGVSAAATGSDIHDTAASEHAFIGNREGDTGYFHFFHFFSISILTVDHGSSFHRADHPT